MSDTLRLNRDLDYFPLSRGLKLRYHHISTEFEGLETAEVEVIGVRRFRDDVIADIAIKRIRMGRATADSYQVRRTGKEVRAQGGVLGFARKEYPVPPLPGKTWIEAPDRHEVASLEAAIEVPAGKFRRCLRVNTYIAGGDGGSAIRYYAPGIGYAYEEYADETWGARVRLVAFEPPPPR